MRTLVSVVSFLLTIVSAIKPKTHLRDVYASSGELTSVFKMEQELVDILAKHKAETQDQLAAIKEYKEEMEQVYKNEGCWPPGTCSDDKLLDVIVGNPIYCYQILKRLIVQWKKLEAKLAKMNSTPTVKEINRIKRKYGAMPTENDLQGAASALNRLHNIYRFDISDFIEGNIMGHTTHAKLDAKDTFYLGRYSHINDDPESALKWLEQAALQAAAAGADRNDTSQPTSPPTIQPNQVDQMIKVVQRKISKDRKRHHETTLMMGYMEDGEGDSVSWRDYQLGQVPPRNQAGGDPTKQITPADQRNLQALCRGIDILPPQTRKKLTCFYLHRGMGGNRHINEIFGRDLYFFIRPLKVEVASPEPHSILVIHNMISDGEADSLIEQALPKINRAYVGAKKERTELRVSKNTWLSDNDSVVERVSRRVNWVTGLNTFLKDDHGKMEKKEEFEFLQIANYGIGGHYGNHQDPMFVYKEPTDDVPPIMNIETPPRTYVTGDRMSTFMLYLSEVPRGGYTAFARLGVAVAPTKGSAVFWNNIKRSGRSDMHMLHSGCPVLLGSKWVANKWIREFANTFHRKCTGHIDL